MFPGASSRRDFLRHSGLLAAGGGMLLQLSGCREAAESAADAIGSGEGPRVLTADEMRAFEAFADRVIPPDGDQPGAGGLGAAVFADHYVAARPEALEQVRPPMAALAAKVREAHPGVESFADLDAAQADALVLALTEDAPDVFWPLQTFVLFGAFAAPARGGNRDKGGWALLGYEDRMAWQPPFGHYDAQADQGSDR
jgi:hypothetical protein